MTLHGKTSSRMQRQVRSQGRGLFVVSGTLLLACTTMTGLYGWSLGSSIIDAAAFAAAFAGADIGGAFLISLSGTCTAAHEAAAAKRATIAAMVCMVFTFVGLLGFQANNREIQASLRERASSVMDSFVGWAKDLALKEVAKDKSKAGSLDKGVGIVGDAIKRQLEMLENGKAAPDGQATTIARMTGMSEAQARSWTIGLTSAVLLFIQYSCWWFYGFIRQRLEPIVAAHAHFGQPIATASDNGSEFTPKFTKDAARSDVVRLIVTGEHFPKNKHLALKWNVSEPTVCNWLRDFKQEGHPVPFRGKGKLRLINGGGGNGAAHP